VTEEEVRALLTLKDYKLRIMNHPSHVYVATIFNEKGIALISRQGATTDDASTNVVDAFVIWDQKRMVV